MSNQIICSNCQFHNPAGSKFCNNCGEKLPLSTTILCPNCETANQIDRIFCDNCGTRLVQDATLADDTPKKEEKKETKSGPQPFSLPMRQPGDTRELNPDLLPAWLRNVSGSDKADDDRENDAEETTPSQNRPSTDELTRIENLSAGADRDDELPDWLLDQIDSDPIIPEAEGITTELYLDLVKEDPELADIAELLEGDSSENDPFDEDADLPNWLHDKSASDIVEEDDVEDGDEADLASDSLDSEEDVLSGLTDILVDPTENQGGSGIGLTDWLSEPDTDKVVDESAQEEDDEPGLTDWLSEAFLPDNFSQDAQKEGSELESDVSDWLSDSFVDEAALEARLEDDTSGTGLTDWLSEVFVEEDDDEASAEAAPSQSQALTDWLQDEDAFGSDLEYSEPDIDNVDAAEAQFGQTAESSGDEGGLTNWLNNLDDLEKPNEAEDWFSALPEEESQEAGLTDWLEGLNQLTDSQIEFSTEGRETDSGDDEDDWLDGLADDDRPLESGISEENERPTGSLSVTDWLSDSAPLTPDETLTEPDSANLPPYEETTRADERLFDSDTSFDANVPGWLGDREQSNETGEESVAQSELDWMLETGGVALPDDQEALVSDSKSEIDEDIFAALDSSQSDDQFDWLADLEDIETGLLKVADAPDEEIEPGQPNTAEEEDANFSQFDDEVAETAEEAEEEDNWDDTDEFLESDGAVGELPEWMTALGPPVGSQPEIIDAPFSDLGENEEIPEWVDQLRPIETDDDAALGSSLPSILENEAELDMAELQLDVTEADMPEWLDIGSDSAKGDDAERSQDIPDWLGDTDRARSGLVDEWDSSLLDKLPPPKKGPQLAAANIPQWLQKFKPEELQDGDEPDISIEEGQEEGEIESVIGGLNGIIKVETAILPSIPTKLQSTLNITPAQTNQIELLRQLLKEADGEARTEEESVSSIRFPNLWEIILVILVLLVLTIGWNAPGAVRFIALPVANGADLQAADFLQAVSNQNVALAVAYTPAMAGEMNQQTIAIVDELLANNNQIIPLTQHVTAVGLMQSDLGFSTDEIIFLPGEAIGLRLLADCLNSDAVACSAVPKLAEAQLAGNIDLIVLVAAERDSLVNWVEQVTTVTDLPLFVSTTHSLAPVASPYAQTEQIDAVVTHQIVTTSRFAEEEVQRTLQRQNKAVALTQLLVIVVFLVALVFYGFIKPIRIRRSQPTL